MDGFLIVILQDQALLIDLTNVLNHRPAQFFARVRWNYELGVTSVDRDESCIASSRSALKEALKLLDHIP